MNISPKKNILWANLQNNSNISLKLWQKVLIRLFILFVLILFLNFFKGPIRNYFYFISSPFSKVLKEAGQKSFNFFEYTLNSNGLKEENSKLKEENQNLLSKLSFLQDTLRKNYLDNELSNNIDGKKFKVVSSQVLGLEAFNDSIVIDKGSDDGITENMPLISSQKVLYGKVITIYKNFSKVNLISNKSNVLTVKIQKDEPDKGSIYGAVKGGGNLSLILDLVDPEAEIKENDIVVTSGLDGTFPSDLLVGKIKSVNKNDLEPFQKAQIQPFFDIKSLDTLFIVTDYLKNEL